MRNSSYEDARAACPYYMVQGAQEIKCEGFTKRGSVTLRFSSGREKKKWLEAKCNSVKGCEGCPIWRMKTERENEKAGVT